MGIARPHGKPAARVLAVLGLLYAKPASVGGSVRGGHGPVLRRIDPFENHVEMAAHSVIAGASRRVQIGDDERAFAAYQRRLSALTVGQED